MSTSQPIWRSRLPAKSPPSDPPMIKARHSSGRFIFVIETDSFLRIGQAAENCVTRIAVKTISFVPELCIMGSESRSFRVAVMAGNMGKEARPPNCPVGTAICAPGASATHWRATHVNWLTRRGWYKRYRRRHARACAPILSVGCGAHSHDHTGDCTRGRDLGAVPRRMS